VAGYVPSTKVLYLNGDKFSTFNTGIPGGHAYRQTRMFTFSDHVLVLVNTVQTI